MGKTKTWVSTIVLAILVIGTTVDLSEAWSVSELWKDVVQQDSEDIYFNLYASEGNFSSTEYIVPGNLTSLKASSYNASRPIILLIHGFISDKFGEFATIMSEAYLETNTEANIIFVDWSELSTPNSSVAVVYYPLAAENVPLVGKTVAEFLLFLIEAGALSGPKDVHIIGHSLGAHVSGFAGQTFLNMTGTLLQRITGLDPAGPAFVFHENEERLDSSDAAFVDIVHTDQDQNGYAGDLGHADFYPNGGGPSQPNCSYASMFTGVCAHSAAYKYYAESIRDPFITACACDEYFPSSACLDPCIDPVLFGEHCPPSARGDYYLTIYF